MNFFIFFFFFFFQAEDGIRDLTLTGVQTCALPIYLEAPLESLSGGNQQKVFLAKTLDPGPRVVMVDEPTRGVDVAAKQEIYRFLAELAAKGAAVVLISSELEEIIGMCDRVVVMREGRIVGELEGNHVEEREIMYMATGLRTGTNS